MHYAEIKTCDIANGPGVRTSLFVSGCTHRCKGCFNEIAWDFNYFTFDFNLLPMVNVFNGTQSDATHIRCVENSK